MSVKVLLSDIAGMERDALCEWIQAIHRLLPAAATAAAADRVGTSSGDTDIFDETIAVGKR